MKITMEEVALKMEQARIFGQTYIGRCVWCQCLFESPHSIKGCRDLLCYCSNTCHRRDAKFYGNPDPDGKPMPFHILEHFVSSGRGACGWPEEITQRYFPPDLPEEDPSIRPVIDSERDCDFIKKFYKQKKPFWGKKRSKTFLEEEIKRIKSLRSGSFTYHS